MLLCLINKKLYSSKCCCNSAGNSSTHSPGNITRISGLESYSPTIYENSRCFNLQFWFFISGCATPFENNVRTAFNVRRASLMTASSLQHLMMSQLKIHHLLLDASPFNTMQPSSLVCYICRSNKLSCGILQFTLVIMPYVALVLMVVTPHKTHYYALVQD